MGVRVGGMDSQVRDEFLPYALLRWRSREQAANKLTPPALYIQRYVLARSSLSQPEINTLWLPPKMEIGLYHAITFRVITLGLLYSPLCEHATLTRYTITATATPANNHSRLSNSPQPAAQPARRESGSARLTPSP